MTNKQNPSHSTKPIIIHEEECEQEGWDDPVHGSIKWWTLLSSDRTPSQSLTCGVAEIKHGIEGTLGNHQHIQPEVYYVLSGQGVVSIDGEDFVVRAGSTVFIPGSLEHGVRSTGDEPLRFFYVFAADSFGAIKYEFPATKI